MNLILIAILISYLLFAATVYSLKDFIFESYNKSPLFVEYFRYIFPMTLFAGLVSMCNAYASIIFKSTITAFMDEIFNRIYQVVILLLYFLHIISFSQFVLLFILMYTVQFIVLAIYLNREDKITGRIDWMFLRQQNWKEIRNFTFMIALATLASRSLRQLDVVMVGSDLSQGIPLEEVAVYTIAATIGAIAEVPANALSKIADSRVSHALHHNDMKLVKTVYYKSERLLSVIGGFLLVMIVINIHDLLGLIGKKYEGGEMVVIIMAGSAFFNMMTGLNNSIIFYSRYYRLGSLLVLGMVILSFGLNYYLIPIYGIVGAAIATACTFSFYNVAKYFIIWAGFGLQPLGKFIPVVLGSIFLCFGINYFLPVLENKYFDIIYRTIILSLIYLPIIWFSGIAPEIQKIIRGVKEKGRSLDLFE